VGTPAVSATIDEAILSPSAHIADSGGPWVFFFCGKKRFF
jgi:hypothetical protein